MYYTLWLVNSRERRRLTPLSSDSTASSLRDTLHSSVAHAAPILALYSVCWVSWLVKSFTRDASSNLAFKHTQTLRHLAKTLIFRKTTDGAATGDSVQWFGCAGAWRNWWSPEKCLRPFRDLSITNSGVRKWLLLFLFPPIPVESFPSTSHSHSHSQSNTSFLFPFFLTTLFPVPLTASNNYI